MAGKTFLDGSTKQVNKECSRGIEEDLFFKSVDLAMLLEYFSDEKKRNVAASMVDAELSKVFSLFSCDRMTLCYINCIFTAAFMEVFSHKCERVGWVGDHPKERPVVGMGRLFCYSMLRIF